MDADSLNNVAVVSVVEAARLGRVTEVLFEIEPLRVAALKAAAASNEFFVPFEQVSNFGTDAVMVKTPDVTELSRQDSSYSHLRSLTELKKLKVVDEAGTYLGTIRTVEFDPMSGQVQRLVAEQGGVLGVGRHKETIDGQAVRGVGSDLLTVAHTPEATGSND
jgi:sporulation protein YlmC with PRC-barrel domain